MKNITLSIPDDLLRQSREYAKRHGTSLNEYIRTLLRQTVINKSSNTATDLFEMSKNVSVNTKNTSLKRKDIYDRKVFS